MRHVIIARHKALGGAARMRNQARPCRLQKFAVVPQTWLWSSEPERGRTHVTLRES